MNALSLKWMLPVAACLALGAGPLAAQEPSPSPSPTPYTPPLPEPAGAEHHHAMAAHHANAIQHSKALHHHAATAKTINKEVAKEHAEEAGRSIEAAEKHTARLEGSMTEAEKKQHAAHLKAIHEHHAQAKQHQEVVTQELNKEQPEAGKVKEHAAQMHHHVTAAQAHHAAIMRARRVREAAPPPSPAASPSPSDR